MNWSERARTVIGEIHARLPKDASYRDRVAALREGYPFGARENHPYKAWLRAQREYLGKFRAGPFILTPPEDPDRPRLF